MNQSSRVTWTNKMPHHCHISLLNLLIQTRKSFSFNLITSILDVYTPTVMDSPPPPSPPPQHNEVDRRMGIPRAFQRQDKSKDFFFFISLNGKNKINRAYLNWLMIIQFETCLSLMERWGCGRNCLEKWEDL